MGCLRLPFLLQLCRVDNYFSQWFYLITHFLHVVYMYIERNDLANLDFSFLQLQFHIKAMSNQRGFITSVFETLKVLKNYK